MDDGPEVETDYMVAATPSGVQSGSGPNRAMPATKSPPTALSNGDGIIALVAITSALILCVAAAVAVFMILRRKRQNRASGGTANTSAAAYWPPGADKPAVFDPSSIVSNGELDHYQVHAPRSVRIQPQHTLAWHDGQPQFHHAPTPARPPTPPPRNRIEADVSISRTLTARPVPPVGTGLTSTAVSSLAVSVISSSAGNGSAHASHSGSALSAGASVVSSKRRLQHELVGMCDREELFMDAYRVLSPREQREGGQGVVQFMRWARTDEPVAVKFFLQQTTFDEEMQLYAEVSLRSMMPVMREAMRAGKVKNRSGYMFPAFAVLERGESLQEWRRNVMPQTATVVDVRALLETRSRQFAHVCL